MHKPGTNFRPLGMAGSFISREPWTPSPVDFSVRWPTLPGHPGPGGLTGLHSNFAKRE